MPVASGGLRIVHMRLTAILLTAAMFLGSACGTPATSSLATASPIPASASPSASASPVASAPLSPTDFVLPQNCSYVGSGAVDVTISTLSFWSFNCGAAPDFQAIEKLSPAFAQQGWTLCSPPMGKGVWAKGALQTSVSQSAVGYPVLSQLPRQTQDCPLPTAYVNSQYKFSLSLPAPYRNSARLSNLNMGGRPAGQDVFTARTDADEATVAGTGCQTACPIWDYVAVVQIYTGAGSDTPRDWYTRFGGAVGEKIETTTVDGRQAVKITNGTHPLQYIVKDGDRMFRIATQYYSQPDMAASLLLFKLEQILTSFRFVP
jgi:hypothetical protein